MASEESRTFYIELLLECGRVIKSDVDDVRVFTDRVKSSSSHIPISGCWNVVQHHIDNLANFRPEHRIALAIEGNTVYFNPTKVVSITLVKL